uniref:Reverse transcriptase domain-containing protein n=1 Tax=Cannabis sativa TaxID=3483 RepID=A0A803QGG4_CANSA
MIKLFTSKEIKKAFFSILDSKSPGPDGFGAGFFKKMWPELGEEFTKAVESFFQTGSMPRDLHTTMLTLIPKVESPSKAINYRSIACCSTVYKCISKLLCSRLAQVLPTLVNENQGAFIQGRSIAHNIMILQDLLKNYNRKNISQRCIIKVDISKAYDTVNWDFLEAFLNAFRMPARFISWIMTCLRATSYTILMNGRVQDNFQGKKGLRQGYPLSPLLFVLIMEYLTRRLSMAASKPDFRGFLWGWNGNRSKLHVASWEKVCLPKNFGGLGFKDGARWNQAVLAKYIWAISNKSDSLWVKWINNIYLKNSSIWTYDLKLDSSWYWWKLAM